MDNNPLKQAQESPYSSRLGDKINPMRRKLPPLRLPGSGGSLTATRAFYEIQNIFNTYLGTQCTLVLTNPEGGLRWMPLIRGWSFIRPHYFEQYYGKIHERDQYNVAQLQKAAKGRRPLLGFQGGYNDLFVPVRVGDECRGVFLSGPFRKEPFTTREIEEIWQRMSGQAPSFQDPDFVRYARMALDIPVFDEVVYVAFEELMMLSAELIAGGDPERIAIRADELRPLFGGHLRHVYWVDLAIGHNKFYYKSEHRSATLQSWEREEMGITRFPTTVVAVMPGGTERREEPLETLVRASRIQYECTRIARKFPETVAGSLGDYGILFLTSADPEKGATQARLEIQDRAQGITTLLRKQFKVPFLAGVGRTTPGGEELDVSFQEAVSVLHLCEQMRKPVLFFGEDMAPTSGSFLALKGQVARMADSFARSSRAAFRSARERFVEQALMVSLGNLEVLRVHLKSALYDLLEAFRHRYDPAEGDLLSLAATLEGRLNSQTGIPLLLADFRDGSDSLMAYGDRPHAARVQVRMESIRRYVDESYAGNLTLPQVSRKFGMSPSAFHRGFRKLTGKTFGNYLSDRRIEEAKRLLLTTSMTLEQVAQASGFNSSSYLIQTFRRRVRMTPGQYRSRRNNR